MYIGYVTYCITVKIKPRNWLEQFNLPHSLNIGPEPFLISYFRSACINRMNELSRLWVELYDIPIHNQPENVYVITWLILLPFLRWVEIEIRDALDWVKTFPTYRLTLVVPHFVRVQHVSRILKYLFYINKIYINPIWTFGNSNF